MRGGQRCLPARSQTRLHFRGLRAFSQKGVRMGAEQLIDACQARLAHPEAPTYDVLERYASQLEQQLHDLLAARDAEQAMCRASAECTFAKNTAGRVLTALFDHATGGKVEGLTTWWETGSIQTRSGPAHWRLDPKSLRDKRGFTLLHATVERSLAKESAKAATVCFLVDTMGLDVNAVDLFGRTSLHYAALAGYADVVEALLRRQCDPRLRDKAGLTALGTLQLTTLSANASSDAIVQALLQHAEKPHFGDEPTTDDALASALVGLHRVLPYVADRAALAERLDVWRQSLDLSLVCWHDVIVSLLSLDDDAMFLPSAYMAPAFLMTWRNQVHLHGGASTAWAAFCTSMVGRCQAATQPAPAPERDTWHYAALLSATAEKLAPIAVEKGSVVAAVRVPGGRYLAYKRLLLGTSVYGVVDANATSLTLDRPFEGPSTERCPVYGADEDDLPPYVQVLTLHERAPGNPFETDSVEEDLVQMHQRMAPDSSYELRLRVGPTSSRAQAKALVAEWRRVARQHFANRTCASKANVCALACPQVQGERLCFESLAAIGRDLAHATFGRATFAKAVPVRASLA
ncbi:hypothetical protein SDRG_12678 [Saprolegnia diclina VS20]|uniref:Uncharacterized protein n=1 Tax=Saprolegnia diclina (strain VS20) TaxID=1156394 RepID=T0Q4Y4_SAPDV|nr:hypothetical protein SDRG_12678 [Saprolegnia diclina VS20]EQC29676.1 hypothetical protein SDRG_12678 [Saprolegnia diclina VS20]|eukprot:XP_008616980.1 hypothetical protein SDRG_12678 [Saprolegnia diclina VS20]